MEVLYSSLQMNHTNQPGYYAHHLEAGQQSPLGAEPFSFTTSNGSISEVLNQM